MRSPQVYGKSIKLRNWFSFRVADYPSSTSSFRAQNLVSGREGAYARFADHAAK
jgi:hypothetical protein